MMIILPQRENVQSKNKKRSNKINNKSKNKNYNTMVAEATTKRRERFTIQIIQKN